MVERPNDTEYAPYYGKYIALVPESDIRPALAGQVDVVRHVAASVTRDRETFRYGPDKWSIREVFGHLSDAERVFGYRAAGISRGDGTPFPSFDENMYVAQSRFDHSPLDVLLEEFVHLRAANRIVLDRLDAAGWRLAGTASGYTVSVRALAYMMVGHVRHHLAILHDRYGVPRP